MRIKVVDKHKKVHKGNYEKFQRQVAKTQSFEELRKVLVDFAPMLIKSTKGGV